MSSVIDLAGLEPYVMSNLPNLLLLGVLRLQQYYNEDWIITEYEAVP